MDGCPALHVVRGRAADDEVFLVRQERARWRGTQRLDVARLQHRARRDVMRGMQRATLDDDRLQLVRLDDFRPRAERLLDSRERSTISRHVFGFIENGWSGPMSLLSDVKCFSMTRAPSAIAPSTVAWPGVWSDRPSTMPG